MTESFSHPNVIGAAKGAKDRLKNFMTTAKQVEKHGSKARIGGKWEHQWDTISVCCYEKVNDYSNEGKQRNPVITLSCSCLTLPHASNLTFLLPFLPQKLLIGRLTTPRAHNQSLMWTAPHHFEGPVVFVYKNHSISIFITSIHTINNLVHSSHEHFHFPLYVPEQLFGKLVGSTGPSLNQPR